MYPNQNASFSGHLGEVREADNGQLYQLGEVMDEQGNVGLAWYPVSGASLGQNDEPQLGEIRQAPDGQLYQYTMDGLGNVGFAPLTALLPLAARALPGIMRRVSKYIRPAAPGAPSQASVDVNSLLSRLSAMLNTNAPNVAGLTDDAELLGIDDDLDLMGIGEDDPDLMGLDEDLDLMGFGMPAAPGADDDADLMGLDDDMDLLGAEEDLDGLAEDDPSMQGYLTTPNTPLPGDNLQGYVRGMPAANPQTIRRTNRPDIWRPLWE